MGRVGGKMVACFIGSRIAGCSGNDGFPARSSRFTHTSANPSPTYRSIGKFVHLCEDFFNVDGHEKPGA